MNDSTPIISVVVPVYDERGRARPARRTIHPVLETAAQGNFEVIFVGADGSRDESAEILDRISAGDPRYKAIHFSRNFGQQPALQAARRGGVGGMMFLLMDADLRGIPRRL